MRHRAITAILALSLALSAATAQAQAAWKVYRNSDFHFSLDAPVPPQVTVTTTTTGAGPMPTLQGVMDMGDHGAFIVTALDLTNLNTSATPDQILEGGVKGALDNTKATLDSEISITVGGAVGREFMAHTDQLKFKCRLIYKDRRVFGVTVTVSRADPVPSEFDRLVATLTPLP